MSASPHIYADMTEGEDILNLSLWYLQDVSTVTFREGRKILTGKFEG